jgi:hypothetical protein
MASEPGPVHDPGVIAIRLLCPALPLLLAAALLPAPATAAAPAVDLRGSWQGTAGGAAGTITITSVDCGTGAVAGTGGDGKDTWTVSGRIDGTTVTLTFGAYKSDPTYSSTGTGTVTDGNRISGTFRDTENYKANDGAFQLTRTSGPPQDGQGCVTRRIAALRVQCNYEVATSIDTCTVTAADAGGAPDPPTGSVRFTKAGGGSFIAGDTCELRRSSGAPATATCSVGYQAPFGSTTFPKVTAAYSGSKLHEPATATTTFLVLTGPLPVTTPDPGTVTVETEIPADGTTVQACATVPAAGAGGAQFLPGRSGKLRELANTLMSGSPAQVERAVKEMTGILGETAKEAAATEARVQELTKAGKTAEAQRLAEQLTKLTSALSALLRAQQDACRASVSSIKSVAGAAVRRRSAVLGASRTTKARKGRLRLRVKLSRAALRRAAGTRKTVRVTLQVHEALPSRLNRRGWPRSTVRRLVLTRDGRLARR